MHDDGLHLGTRDKVVQKMTREGAVEENISENYERRVSARASDADFSHLHGEAENAADHSAAGSNNGDHLSQKSRRSQNVHSEKSGHGDFDSDHAAGQSAGKNASRTPGNASASHKRKKKQVQKAEAEKRRSSKLNFDNEGSSAKGINLGGRFSSITGKAVVSGASLTDHSVQTGENDENDVSRDVAEGAEETAVTTAGTAKRAASFRSSNKSRRAEKFENKTEEAAGRLKFEAEAETAETAKKPADASRTAAKKEAQHRAVRKKYASAYRSGKSAERAAGGAAKTAEATETVAEKLRRTATQAVKKNKGVIAALVASVLIFVAVIDALGTFGSVFAGTGTTTMQSTYLASDDEIYAAEDAYAAMETALQRQIDNIESQYPGYDEYNYQVDEISHNPYSLTSYLTVLFGNYSSADVQSELAELFEAQYHMTVEGSTQTITETRTVRVGESLGQVVTSGYCNCSICCGRWAGGATASGAMPQASHTIAVDAGNPTVPMGTKVIMNGVEYTVEDTGNFARYGVDFDVYYDSHSAASAHGHKTWEAYLADDNGSRTVEVTDTRTVKVLNVTLTNSGLDTVVKSRLGALSDGTGAVNWYNTLNAAYGNRDYLWDKTTISGYTPDGMSYEIPPEALSDTRFRNMITEAEKYLGYPYVWGGASPSTSFDCSGFVSWVINNCGNGWNMGRLTAEGLRTSCTYVSPDQAKPGDLIFFQGTYDTAGASHVGIYVGNGMMIHCGNPIQYASIETSYWQQHFYCFGRLPD